MFSKPSFELATEIAVGLGELEAFSLYYSYTQKYPEELLRTLLHRTLSIPPEKIKKSRGALFTYLVEQYGKTKRYDGH